MAELGIKEASGFSEALPKFGAAKVAGHVDEVLAAAQELRAP